MAPRRVVSVSGVALVFIVTWYLVSSDSPTLHSIVSGASETGSVEETPKEVKPSQREPVAGMSTSDCLVGDEAKVCDNASLPMLVFVAGIEGSGHHMVSSLFSHLFSFALDNQFKPWQHIYESPPEVTTLYYSIIEKELYERRLESLTKLMDKAMRDKKLATMVYASSFPMGLHSGTYATARPDLIDLKDFECKLYRIKFLVTRRHPLAAVMSAVRRFGSRVTQYDEFKRIPNDKKAGLNESVLPYTVTARIAEDNLIYIDQQVRQLGCHQVHFIDYDKVVSVATREKSLRQLATFLEMTPLQRKTLLSVKLAKSNTKVTIPPRCTQCIEKTLYEFFEERKMMWPLLLPQ